MFSSKWTTFRHSRMIDFNSQQLRPMDISLAHIKNFSIKTNCVHWSQLELELVAGRL